MIGIYHNADVDGFMCGAIMKLKYPDIKLIGYDYGMPFDLNMIYKEDVVMADISLPMRSMEIIFKMSKSFLWVDHHVSAITDFATYFSITDTVRLESVYTDEIYKCDSVRGFCLDTKKAACELLYKCLFPTVPISESIKLCGEYDSWRNEDKKRWNNVIVPFQFSIASLVSSAEEAYNYLLDNPYTIDYLVGQGVAIQRYVKRYDETSMKKSFVVNFETYRTLCVNQQRCSTGTFSSIYDENLHDMMLSFYFNGSEWYVSLRSIKEEVDVSLIAKKYGGGGHKHAAAFKTKELSTILGGN